MNAKKKQIQQQAEQFQNVKAVVRVRPLTRVEREQKVKNIVNCATHRDLQIKDKKYTFDRVFKPSSTQIELYLNVVAPLIKDVIAGYNCTIFAYGQTGTGKTYTMTGDKCTPVLNWKEDEYAGIIPRAAFHIFDEINKLSKVDVTVKVSFMELYNEEIRDLLSNDENALQLFNDTKGGLKVHGLLEKSVKSSEEILQNLQCGILKRQMAPTLMNHQSSRSHSVFTIMVHISETSSSGEIFAKFGKINLVDLAGSENIAKSGCKDLRAIELANINKSLLTLGRVIHALADRSQKHVPYRDSKLTRILQDSLGGQTKTVIIATVSPSHTSHEETVSTLEYATRARDIKNNPIVNEKISQDEIIQELLKEIERLQEDLDAARSGTGFYVHKGNFQKLLDAVMAVTGEELTPEELSERKEARIKNLEKILTDKMKEFKETIVLCKKREEELDDAKRLIIEKDQNLERERFLASLYEEHSSENYVEAQNLLKAAHTLTSEKEILLAKLEQQFDINKMNHTTAQNAFKDQICIIDSFSKKEEQLKNSIESRLLSVQQQMTTHKDYLELTFDNMKNVTANIDRERLNSFSVQAAIGGETTRNRIDLMKQKIAEFEIISNEYREHNILYRDMLPKLVDNHTSRIEEVIQTASEYINNQKSQYIYNNCLNQSKIQKAIEGTKAVRENDERMLRYLEELVQAAKQRIEDHVQTENRLENLLTEISTQNNSSSECVERDIAVLEKLGRESIENVSEMATSCMSNSEVKFIVTSELIDAVKGFEKDLENISRDLDNTYKTVMHDSIDSITRLIDKSCNSIEEVIEQKINSLHLDVQTMIESTSCLHSAYRTFVSQIKDTLTQQNRQIVAARHVGDTPDRGRINFPTSIKEIGPRQALIEKFRSIITHNGEIATDIFQDATSDTD